MLRFPSLSEIMEVSQARGRNSEDPNSWNGLVGAYPPVAGGGLILHDVSGFGNHGTLTNMDPATGWVVTEKGRALRWSSDWNDKVVVPNSASLNPPFLTIACWSRQILGGDINSKPLMLKSFTSHDPPYYQYGIFSGYLGGQSSLYVAIDGVLRYTAAVSVISPEDWHHLCGTYDGTYLRLFVDGILRTTSAAYPGQISTYPTTLNFGDFANLTDNLTYQYQGTMFGHVVYSRALLPSEIQQLYSDPWAMYRLRRRVFVTAEITDESSSTSSSTSSASISTSSSTSASISSASTSSSSSLSSLSSVSTSTSSASSSSSLSSSSSILERGRWIVEARQSWIFGAERSSLGVFNEESATTSTAVSGCRAL